MKRVYTESVKKGLIGSGITVGTIIGGIFLYLFAIGAISNVSYSGDTVCAGTELDPCYAYINFTANEDIFIYPTNYDPWGRDTLFDFDPNVKSWKLQRSWGTGWRDIPLDKSCTGTWCGLSDSSDTRVFSVAFREGRDYQIRIVAYKNSPYDTIKWGAFSGVDEIDPVWIGINGSKVISSIKNVRRSWVFEIEEDYKQEVNISINEINNNTLEVVLDNHENSTTPSNYKWNMVLCNYTQGNLQYMVEDAQGGFNYSVPLNVVYGSPVNYGMNETWCDGGEGYILFSSGSKNQFPKRIRLIVNNITDFKLYAGTGSVLISSTTEGTGTEFSFIDRVFYDLNNRSYVLFSDNESDIVSLSSPDGITWGNNIEIGGTTLYGQADYDCFMDTVDSNNYLHCVYARETYSQEVYYRRMVINETSPYLFVGSQEIAMDDSLDEIGASDEISYPRITVDSNHCVLIATNVNNATTGNMVIFVVKEDLGTTCGDGDFDVADIETGFPLSIVGSISDETFPLGIETFGDLDAQIVWIDTNSVTSADIETIFFNGTSNSFGTQRTLETDVEMYINTRNFNMDMVIIGNTTIVYGMDDGTNDVDAYIIVTKDGSKDDQVNTGIDSTAGDISNYEQGRVSSVVDTVGGDVWVFAVDDADLQDIYYAISSDNGATWSDQTLWQNEATSGYVDFLSSAFNSLTCNITLSWIGGASPYDVRVDTINTGSCVSAPLLPEINYSVALPNGVIRFLNCSPDWEDANSWPDGQTATIAAINATNNGTASGNFTINVTGALNTGWTIWASNDSLVNNLTLSTSAQNIWYNVTINETKKIWLAANCSYVSANPGQSISMWAI